MNSGTIAAIATPVGEGGIAIIRISGPDAYAMAARVFRARSGVDIAQLRGYTVLYGEIVEADSSDLSVPSVPSVLSDQASGGVCVVDDGLITAYRAPHSYTGEDVCEISCHGGSATTSVVLNLVLQAGARLADPGEFTLRAFLNGRIDLAQAEAVSDLVRARTESARRIARRQLNGELSAAVAALRSDMIGILAAIEVTIDFSDEVGELDYDDIRERLNRLNLDIIRLQNSAGMGRILREGLDVAILGRPNVGKSSLLNAMLRSERAIVTPIPGTTRDTIEESVVIGGLPVVLVDTAGLRETDDQIEQIGVERTKDAAVSADVALFVLDASAGVTAADIALVSTVRESGRCIIVCNKSDLVDDESLECMSRLAPEQLGLVGSPLVTVSALSKTGVDELEEKLVEPYMAFDGRRPMGPIGQFSAADPMGSVVVSRERHTSALEKARHSLSHAEQSAQENMPGDFIAIDIRGALDALGYITGETVTDDIIHRIFSDFCVGK